MLRSCCAQLIADDGGREKHSQTSTHIAKPDRRREHTRAAAVALLLLVCYTLAVRASAATRYTPRLLDTVRWRYVLQTYLYHPPVRLCSSTSQSSVSARGPAFVSVRRVRGNVSRSSLSSLLRVFVRKGTTTNRVLEFFANVCASASCDHASHRTFVCFVVVVRFVLVAGGVRTTVCLSGPVGFALLCLLFVIGTVCAALWHCGKLHALLCMRLLVWRLSVCLCACV